MSTFRLKLLIAAGLMTLVPVVVILFHVLSIVLRAQRRRGKPLICDDCGRADVRPSWQTGAVDRLLTGIGYYPYKCRACNFRFYRQRPDAPEESAQH